VDEGRLARAFGHTENEVNEFVASLVLGKGIQSLVDLGCGPAALLRDLCRREPRFCGWGVDRSRMMCRRATDLIAAAGLSDRLRIINADVRQLKHHFEPGDRERVDAIHGSSLFNEFVHSGGAGVVTLLNELQELFPGRLLFNVDYYGKLTAPTEVPSRLLHSVVMDVCQVLSAQGVPPGTREGWAILYQRAGCTLLEVHEAEADGIDAFVHVLRL
jgi:SAM-dependent methyltransferase